VSGLNGNGHIHNGEIGDIVFHVMTPGLALEMREVGFRAKCHIGDLAEHKSFEDRRTVAVLHQGNGDLTAAMLAADWAQDHHHAARAGVLDMGELGFFGKPGEFVAWWDMVRHQGSYENLEDFVSQAWARVKFQPVSPPEDKAAAAGVHPDVRVNEADDDPHRLARIHFAKFRWENATTLRFYRGDWLGWARGAYQRVVDPEVESGVAQNIKTEFDRLNRDELQKWESPNV
jgi:hypothetical protein